MATPVFSWSAASPNVEAVSGAAASANNTTTTTDPDMGAVADCSADQVNIEWAQQFIDTSSGDGLGDFTMAVYFRMAQQPAQSHIFAQKNDAGGAPHAQVAIYANANAALIDSAGSVAFVAYNNGTLSGVSAALGDGDHILVARRSGTTYSLHSVDAETGVRTLLSSATAAAVGITQASPTRYTAIGSRGNGSTQSYDGVIAWAQAFDSALSDAEIEALPADVAADTTAPTLSSPTGTATGSTTASGSVSTDEANGTLYRLASTNATELAAAVKAAALTTAVSATGVQSTGVTFSGLTASTTYYAHYLHSDAAGNDSAVVSSASFTTDAAGGGSTPIPVFLHHLRQQGIL